MHSQDENYARQQTELTTLANLVLHMELADLIRRADVAESLGPVMDPTLYKIAGEALGRIRRIAEAALAFKLTVEKEFREAGWRQMPALWTQDAVDVVWITGKETFDENPKSFEIQGVFDSKDKAIDACKDVRYFIGPLKLNQALPDEKQEWPGAIYPLAEKENTCPD
jgi:hypothetical protein